MEKLLGTTIYVLLSLVVVVTLWHLWTGVQPSVTLLTLIGGLFTTAFAKVVVGVKSSDQTSPENSHSKAENTKAED